MKIIKTAIALFMLIMLVLFNSSHAINIRYSENYNSSDFDELWAVIATFGSRSNDNKNAEDLINILKNNGWNSNNILYMKGTDASKDAILNIPDTLNDLGVKEDDLILFFFSMHGNRIEDVPPLDEPDNMDEAIRVFDKDTFVTDLIDDDLGLMFEEIKCNNMVIMFETCFSGGMIDGTSDLKKSGRIIMTSAKENETSFGRFFLKGWLFPHLINRGLKGWADRNRDGFITAEEAFTFAYGITVRRSTFFAILLYIVHGRLIIQHPQIYDGWPTEENNEEELKLTKIN
jgi:hypothetical protein